MKSLLSFTVVSLVTANTVLASDRTIYVAPKDTAAYEQAQNLAAAEKTTAHRKIHKAFTDASSHLTSCQSCTVTIKIAHGTYQGKAKAGHWVFPDTIAPNANLKIVGGWDDSFKSRTPFTTPSILEVNPNRSNAIIKFQGRKHALNSLILSGLTINSTPSNRYDAETNSLKKGSSSTYGHLAFGYLKTNQLLLSDNTFIAATHKVGAPLIRAASDEAEIILENNIFFNNVHTWVVSSGASSKMPKHYIVRGNSFILNWPYNPDRTTSNPGTLEIGNNYSAKHVIIENNLFAYNYGGAIHPQWDDTRGPKISILNNLFYGNGALFSDDDMASGAVVGKFAGSATHSIFSAEDLEDDFSWIVSANVSFDPELEITIPKTKSLQSLGERSDSAEKKPATAEAKITTSQNDSALSDELAELENLMSDIDTNTENSTEVEPTLEDIDLGFSFDSPTDENPGSSNIGSYAPKINLMPGNLPFPSNEDAKKYGASPNRVAKY